jgi:hypothetical protein
MSFNSKIEIAYLKPFASITTESMASDSLA